MPWHGKPRHDLFGEQRRCALLSHRMPPSGGEIQPRSLGALIQAVVFEPRAQLGPAQSQQLGRL